MNPNAEKQNTFHAELNGLLKKYSAEITIHDFGRGFNTDLKVVVEFDYDTELEDGEGGGIIPDLVLGMQYRVE